MRGIRHLSWLFVVCLLGALLVTGSGASVGVAGPAGDVPSPRLAGGLDLTAISPNAGNNGTTVVCTVSGTFTPLNGDLVGAPVFSLEQGTTTIRGTTQDWSAATGSATVSFVLPATAPGGSYVLLATQRTTFGEAVGALDDAFTISPKYPFLILADKSFLNALAPLVRFKDATGMPTTLRSWQSFQAQYASQAKTVQERIKRGIADYYQTYGTRYVMLVGNGDRFPIAWITGEGRQKIDNYTAFDMYYACLFKQDGSFDDWDGNGNGYIGQVRFNTAGAVDEDGAYARPDVGLGRIPASTVAQVTTYVKKVIAYESGSYGRTFTGDVLLLATDWQEDPPWSEVYTTAIGKSDWYASQFLSGMTVTRLYSGKNPDLTPVNLANALNAGQLLVTYLGHGYDAGLAFPSSVYNIDDMTGANGVPALTNSDRLPVIYSGGCDTAKWSNWPGAVKNGDEQFSTWVDVHGVTHKSGVVLKGNPPRPAAIQPLADLPAPSFGASMLLNGPSGAIAYYGATLYGQFPNEIGVGFFWGWDGNHTTGMHLGDIWATGVDQYYDIFTCPDTTTGGDDAALKNAEFIQPWKYTLLGDPSLRLGGVAEAAPQNASLPVVSGTPARSAILSCSPGDWTGCPYPSLNYQWQRNGVAIAGATTARHVVVAADYGTMLSCAVTAGNAAGTATAESLGVSVTGNSPNLVANGGAELGSAAPDGSTIVPPEKWKTTGAFTAVVYGATGGFPDATVSTAVDGGTAFFAGGNAAVSTATQTCAVPAAWRSWVKLGFVKGVLSADLGGWGDQDDDATVTAVFLNKSGHTLRSLKIGPVTEAQRQGQTTLLLRSKSVAVPPKTAKVRLVITATGAGGAYNDGYVDNVVFVLHR